ncbi:MAG: phosphoesterase [Paenibacillaceae bacterium]|jgi:predicted MPP superfamily phosphohydrolase|nr:phosphoesterase [Paenibacillaceae bacterium]
MFILIAIGILIVYGLLVFYIGRSGWSWIKPAVPSRWFRIFYIVALVFFATSFIWGQMLGDVTLISIIGAYWMAVFSLLLMLVPLVHLSLWLLRLTRLPRRRFEQRAGLLTLIILIALMGYGSFNAYSPVVRKYELQIDKPVEGLQELNIVMAADMHFGLLSGPSHARRMVEEINALEPDLVLYPGDIIDDDLDAFVDSGIGEIIAGIEAPYGVYASLGNHDKYRGRMEVLIEALEKSNMRVLYDESVIIGGKLELIGRKDRTESDRLELADLMKDSDRSRPILLMDHQPYDLGIARDNGVDLMLSGHTHRGQIAPAHLITRAIYENDWGYLKKESLHSVVTSGFGFWGPPIRLGSRSEIVQIHVTFVGQTGS